MKMRQKNESSYWVHYALNIDEDNAMTHVFSKLSPDIIISAVESQAGYADGTFFALNSYENRVFQVGLEDSSPIIVKFYRPNRWSRQQILEEHTFIQELFDEEWPVVPPIKNEHGETLFEWKIDDQIMYFSLFERKGGRAPEFDNFEHLYSLGQYLAKLHAVGKRQPFVSRVTINIQEYGYDNVQFLLRDFIPSSLREAYERITSDILDDVSSRMNASTGIEWIRCHGDCHLGNILWRDDRPNFVDFDDTCMAPAIQDIWMMLSGDRVQQTDQLTEIIEGYELFQYFNYDEFQLIETFRVLRMINYSAWLAKRNDDPAFQRNFTWFNTERYWGEHILQLKEQYAALREPSITVAQNV
jgi:Ser/Thr protein kinase RdoA (MazF antagonist)